MRAGTTNGLDINVVYHDALGLSGQIHMRCQTIYHGGGNIGGSEISLEVLVADRIEPIRAECGDGALSVAPFPERRSGDLRMLALNAAGRESSG
ncbi:MULTISPECIES: hypothetical protein [Sinorhizobium]|uniref:hypothetical protein n=1 Tax=Sinorhizobium TaxID=28105 RepID=UPI001F4708B5|nr:MULTISPECIES: hypothetical protein [Sinorhizobium]